MKLYTEQQLKEAMKTIALHVYDNKENKSFQTILTINNFIAHLKPHHSVETNKMISDEEIEKRVKEVGAMGDWYKMGYRDAIKWYREHLNPEP